MRVELLATEFVVAEELAVGGAEIEHAAIGPWAVDLARVRLRHMCILVTRGKFGRSSSRAGKERHAAIESGPRVMRKSDDPACEDAKSSRKRRPWPAMAGHAGQRRTISWPRSSPTLAEQRSGWYCDSRRAKQRHQAEQAPRHERGHHGGGDCPESSRIRHSLVYRSARKRRFPYLSMRRPHLSTADVAASTASVVSVQSSVRSKTNVVDRASIRTLW
jgi:hypothetical protein